MNRVARIADLNPWRISELAEYWDRKRGDRPMPSREDIDPAEIKRLLPNLVISRIERDPLRVKYSLVGTYIAESGGLDFSGYYLDEIDFKGEVGTDWAALYRELIRERRPICGICQFRTEAGYVREYLAAMFPLSSDGVEVDQCLSIEDWPANAKLTPEDLNAVPPRRLRPPKS